MICFPATKKDVISETGDTDADDSGPLSIAAVRVGSAATGKCAAEGGRRMPAWAAAAANEAPLATYASTVLVTGSLNKSVRGDQRTDRPATSR